MTDLYNHGENPSFAERIASLAGKTTFRVPVEGRGTKSKRIPDEHAIAMALAYARQDADDIGPDLAYDMATASIRHRARIVRAVAGAMGKNRTSRPVSRNRPWLNMACNVAYCEIMGYRSPMMMPVGIREDDWALLVEASKRIMLTMAETAVQRAESAYHRTALDRL